MKRPGILDVFLEYVEAVRAAPVAFLLAGAGIGLVRFPLNLVAMLAAYAGMGVGIVPGVMLEDDFLLLVGAFGGPLVAAVAVGLLSTVLLVPLEASLVRALDKHYAGADDYELGPKSCFDTALDRPLGPIFYVLVHMAIYAMLVPFLFVPAILFAMITDLGWPIAVVERVGPFEAFRRAWGYFREDVPFHLGYWLLVFLMALTLQSFPFIGVFIVSGLVAGWRVYVYRRVRNLSAA